MSNVRRDWIVLAIALAFAVSCSGGSGCGGCGSLETIPNGFPAAKRNANAVQVRVSSGGVTALNSDAPALVGLLAGSGSGSGSGLVFNVPASCSSPDICCPNGSAQSPCGPLDVTIDSINIVPDQGSGELTVTIDADLKSEANIPITEGISCGAKIDTLTADGGSGALVITLTPQFVQDATTGTTRINFGTPTIGNLESSDITLVGDGSIGNDLECDAASFGLSVLLPTLESTLAGELTGPLDSALCKSCPDGTLAECGQFASSCTAMVCDEGSGSGTCLQELGIDGRELASALFGSVSPTTTGAFDLYEVAGGYGTTDNGGISLGLLGGMEPAGSARDRCGPESAEPTPVAITPSAFFAGNTRPDTGSAFDIAIGIHQSQLDQFAYAAYDGGLLCLTIGHNTVAELSTATISLLAHSLNNLNETSAPVAVGLRPQSPPVLTLGTNTFTTSGSDTTLTDPLIDMKFTAMEIDFFAAVDDQYIRIFTVVADVDLPIGLQVTTTGELTPVLGATTSAFTNLSVKNSEAVTETPAQLAAVFPQILSLVLPQLSAGFSPIALPSIGGLQLSVDSITSVPQASGGSDLSYLAIFADFALATTFTHPEVDTGVTLAGVTQAAPAIAADPSRWSASAPPSVRLGLTTSTTTAAREPTEFSYRIDHGTWSAWSKNAHPVVASGVFWLAGTHELEARARVIGHPESMDRTPASVTVDFGANAPSADDQIKRSGGTPYRALSAASAGGGAGCACDAGAGPGAAAPFAILLALVVMWPRRKRAQAVARARGLGAIVWAAAIAALPGCSCSSAPCGSSACMDGAVAHGALGQWTSIAGDDARVMVATYDQGLGDLVAVDATDMSNLTYVAVDGVPDATPTYDPSTYRGGISDAGSDVGAWTSIVLSNSIARIAYQDRDASALKYAYETKPGVWASYVIDDGSGATVGQYANMILDGAGNPAIGYLAVGVDDGSGHRVTELRLARTTSANPLVADWYEETIASAPGTCAGLCTAPQVCVAGSATTDPETCVTPDTTCTTACGSGSACVSSACVAEIADPTVSDIPTGTGLFVHLGVLSDKQMVAAYYDRTRAAMVLGVEALGGSAFTETILDGNVAGEDRGMWCSAVVDASDTVHVAYQDAIGNQVMYTTWDSATNTVGMPAVVDDGERSGDRPHPVGQSSAIYLVNGSPVVAYQDGLAADLDVSTSSGSGWTLQDLVDGPTLDGFSIAVTTGHGSAAILAWDSIDPTQSPPNGLAIQSP